MIIIRPSVFFDYFTNSSWVRRDNQALNPLRALSRVGISGTTAKSRQRKFVPSSDTGPVALVASPGKSKTKVGILACFDFL